MLPIRHVSDRMVKVLRPQREPLDALALLVSVVLHAGLLAYLGHLHYRMNRPVPPKEDLVASKPTPPVKITLAERPPAGVVLGPRGTSPARPRPATLGRPAVRIRREPPPPIARAGRLPAPLPVEPPRRTETKPPAPPAPGPLIAQAPNTPIAPGNRTSTPNEPMRDPTAASNPSQDGGDQQLVGGAPVGPIEVGAPRRPGVPPGTDTTGGNPTATTLPRPPTDWPGTAGERTAGHPRGAGPLAEGPLGTPGGPGGAPAGNRIGPRPLPELPRARFGEGGGSGPVAARELGGGPVALPSPSRAVIARADLPLMRSGLAGGSELPGNGRPAPDLPSLGGGGADPVPVFGLPEDPRGAQPPVRAAGGQDFGALRPRATASPESPGTGSRGPLVAGGTGGLGTLPGPGNGAGTAGEGPGRGRLVAALPGGSGGEGYRPGRPGEIPSFGRGGEGAGTGAGVGNGPGGPGGPGALDFGTVRRGQGGTGDGPGDGGNARGDVPGPGGTGFPRGDGPPAGAGGLGGEGLGPGRGAGPGGGSGIGLGGRQGPPPGVYVTTTGHYSLPSAVTGSDYQYHDLARRKILDEINSRTKLRVALGGHYRVIRANLLTNAPVLVFSGHRPIRLTDEQREELRRYVARGGMIWADFSGTAFDRSFQEEMVRTFGQGFTTLSLDHPIYRSFYTLQVVPKGDTGRNEPYRAIVQDGRVVVLITPNRYLAAVVGPPSTDVETQEGALQAVVNLYVYAAAHFKAERED